MMNKQVELLAPAGNLEKLKWAFLYGADAVYIGGVNYSLRANAKNFTLDEIKEGVIYAHNLNKKVYVAVNIVFHNEDTKDLLSYLKKLEEIKVDAIIVSDPLVIDIVNENKLNLELHLSTQASVLNRDAARYFVKQNVKRIVLARECSKYDIKNIINNVDVDIECFIHGAMCTNISGRCVLSNYFTLRDANRGGCCQVCRFNFSLYDNKDNLMSNNDNFSIAPCDLSMKDNLKEMIDIGIKSFKLEGRMRSIYYISTICSCYRKLIDMYLSNTFNKKEYNKINKILSRCANRDVSSHFFNKEADMNDQYYLEKRSEDSNQDFLGIVKSYDSNKKELTIEQRNYFKIGDKINIFSPDGTDYSFIIEYIKNENNELIDAARHPREIIKINCDKNIVENSLIRVNFLD